MKILLAARMFDNLAGGLERSASRLLNDMCKRGHDVHLLTWDQAGAECYYPLDDRITWHKLDMGDPMQVASTALRLKRMLQIRRIVYQAGIDSVVAFQSGAFLSVALSLFGTGIPVIASERNPPQRFYLQHKGLTRQLVFSCFLLAKKLILQMPSYRDHFPAYLSNRIEIIPNPVYPSKTRSNLAREREKKVLLSVGRLEYEKNMQVLVKAFCKIANDHPDWILRIAGEGVDREELEKIASANNLIERIELPGNINDVTHEYLEADLFCLTSRWEGFPNALVEAFAAGLPAIGFADCAGLNELIINEHNGLLAEGINNPDSLAETLSVLMKDKEKRISYAENSVKISEKYTPDSVFDLWEQLFKTSVRI